MKEVHIVRRVYAETFVMGEAFCGGPKWYCLELPWAYNHPDTSCISTGTYKAVRHTRADGLKSLLLLDVPGRSEVEIHPGNTTQQTHGCILLGKGAYCSLTAAGITDSDKALEELYAALDGEEEVVVAVVNYGDLAHDPAPYPQGEENQGGSAPDISTQKE